MSLSDRLAYFVLKAPYKAWTEAEKHPQRMVNVLHRVSAVAYVLSMDYNSLQEKPICDNHKAGNDNGVRWVGQDVTGIGVFTCTSHSCIIPRGVVDYYKGERCVVRITIIFSSE